MARTLVRAHVGYEDGLHAWLVEQAVLARAGRTTELDLAKIALELEASGGSERRELESRRQQILLHLWKLADSPDQLSLCCNYWASTAYICISIRAKCGFCSGDHLPSYNLNKTYSYSRQDRDATATTKRCRRASRRNCFRNHEIP
jgi:hypothetical protein